MKKNFSVIFFALHVTLLFCQVEPGAKVVKEQGGIYYITLKNGMGESMKDGYYAHIDYILFNHDTVIYNSYVTGVPHVVAYDKIPCISFSFNCLLHYMSVGDSTLFTVAADSIFRSKDMPSYIKPGSFVYYAIKLNSQQSKEEYDKEVSKQKELMGQLAAEEQKNLDDYLKKNRIRFLPEENGMYYIEKKRGKGASPRKGGTAYIYFRCTLIDGREIFNTCRSCEPAEFVLGKGSLLRSVEEGLIKMKEGGKSRLIIPSSLAYGAEGYQTVPSYSTLIVDIELVKVK